LNGVGEIIIDRSRQHQHLASRLLERLDAAARDELRLGLSGPTTARAGSVAGGNQMEVLACARREGLTAAELRGVADLVRRANSAKPRSTRSWPG
jgi:hypothetical protein